MKSHPQKLLVINQYYAPDVASTGQLAAEIWSKFGGIEELQLVQDDLDHIELRIVAQQPLDATQQRSLTDGLGQALGQPYRFSIRHHDEILRHANGKYERFICQV